MQIVIKIPDRYAEMLPHVQNGSIASNIILNAVKNGVTLPKHHGRLIDADDVNNHIIGYVDLRCCPTIIKAESEDK